MQSIGSIGGAKPSSAGGTKTVTPEPSIGSHSSSAATGKQLASMAASLKERGLSMIELAQQGLTSPPGALFIRKYLRHESMCPI